MHQKFLKYLVDPATGEKLELKDEVIVNEDILTGTLISTSNSYKIMNGIPRFVVSEEKDYTKSFGYQWNKWRRIQFDDANKGKPMEGYTKMMWEKICGAAANERFDGKVILDIGCGPGRFLDIALTKGAMVIGIDYSNAVEPARENFSHPDVCILQADALKLPIATGVLDASYSIGVLHHTPDPSRGVAEAYRVLKNDGWFAISVYAKGGYYDKAIVQAWRKFFNLLWPVFKHYPPLIYSHVVVSLFRPVARLIPFLGKVIRAVFPFVNLADHQWSVLDTFDSLTPSYQSAHESFEVFSWYKKNKFSAIEPTDWGFTGYKGVKKFE